MINIAGLNAGLTSTNPTRPGAGGATTAPRSTRCCSARTASARRAGSRPSCVHNTVDNPYTPRAGMQLHGRRFSSRAARSGGTVNYFRPELEVDLLPPALRRKTALGMRAPGRAASTRTATPRCCRYYQRFFLGGETQIRGVQHPHAWARSTSQRPRARRQQVRASSTPSTTSTSFGPLRALLFFDAGQAFLEGDPINLSEFRTSTGGELRFIMPVLNVPFRLIYAFNPNRETAFQKPTRLDLQVRGRHHLLRRRQ